MRRIAFASSFVKSIDDVVIDARQFATEFSTIQYLPNFANNRLAHKERYVSIENSRSAFRAGLLRLAIPWTNRLQSKTTHGVDSGIRLFVSAFLLADGLLGLLYEVVEFFF